VELKISATPNRAAVFVDDQFAGMWLSSMGQGRQCSSPRTASSTYRFAWLPAVRDRTDVRAHQKLKIQTELAKEVSAKAGTLVTEE